MYFSLMMVLSIIFLLLIMMMLWVKKMNIKDYIYLRSKSSTFECGFEMKDQSRQPFSLRFFFIMMIFLMFDMELCLLLNLPILKILKFLKFRIMMFFLMFILIVGIMEEWRRGLLSWK